MKNTITVLVPVYNMGKYLRICFDSILAQTYTDFILLVVEDGSTDESATICDEYAARDSRVQVIHTKNQGQDMARNTGLSFFYTDLIAMVDSDDCVNCHFLEYLITTMKKNDADMVYGKARNFEDDREIDYMENFPDWENSIRIFSSKEFLTLLCTAYDAAYPVPHKLYRAHVFEGVRYPPVRVNIDEWTTHHLILNCKKIATVQTPIYYYRLSAEGMTRSFSVKKISGVLAQLDRIETMQKAGYEEFLPSLYKRFYETAEQFYWNCKKYGYKVPKQLKKVKPSLRKAYRIAISKQTDTYSRKQMFVQWMFGHNFFIYQFLHRLFDM